MRPAPSNAPKWPAWCPPKIWDGETVFVIGGGPSLSGTDLTQIHTRRVLGTNQAFELGDWVDAVVFGDQRWFWWNREALRTAYKGLIISACPEMAAKTKNPGWVHVMKRGKPNGIDANPGLVAWNGNTGAVAINVAYHLGAARVVLVAFDMKPTHGAPNGGNNWHGKHRYTPQDPYPRFMKYFQFVARDAERLGLEIINATPGSALDVFPIVTLESCL